MNRYKKELDHEKQITSIMCMVCPDHHLMRWEIEKLLRNGYPTEKIVKIVKGYCQGDKEWAYKKAIAKLKMGCTGCVHYDQQRTASICHECKRYYKDMYKE